MEWWSIFYKIRRIIFGVIAVASLLWAVVLSIYTARMWGHLVLPQKIIVLSIIGANVFTTLLLYLMAVVVFRVWLDLARVVFLLLIHIACSLMFTLFGSNFSCDTWKTKTMCKHVDLAFVVGSWVITGLLLGYIPYLLVMLRMPHPIPKVTPNLLLETPSVSRRSSTSSFGSITSKTGLLRSDTVKTNYTTQTSRTVPKRLFIANSSPVNTTPEMQQWGMRSWEATGSAANSNEVPALLSPASIYPATPRAAVSTTPAALQSTHSISPNATRRQSPRPLPNPPLFLNPFLDPLPRQTTPASTFSQPSPTNTKGIERYEVLAPSQAMANGLGRASPVQKFVVSSSVPAYSPYDSGWLYAARSESISNLQPAIVAGPLLRTHTATPHSIHSVAPSMHFFDSHAPATVHARSYSDPVRRPQTAAPTHIDPDAPLPNPFPMVGSSEVRRFGSVPSAQFYTGQGGTYRHTRNLSHLAGALGRTPPRVEAAVMNPEQWKQLVFTAATGRTM